MTTWRLWRALNAPPTTNPLFWRTKMAFTQYWRWSIGWRILAAIAMLLGVVYYPAHFIPLLMLLPILFILLGGTIYGSLWAASISGNITRTREQGLYELLSTTPGGALGTSWAICTGCLHRNQAFKRSHSEMTWLIVLLLGMILFAGASILLTQSSYSRRDTLIQLNYITALIAACYIDYIQSVTLSSVVGMTVATYSHNRADARVWALGTFLFCQVSVYVLVLLVGIVLLPLLLYGFSITGLYAELSLPLLRILGLVVIREIVVTILWNNLTSRLNASPLDDDLVVNPRRDAVQLAEVQQTE